MGSQAVSRVAQLCSSVERPSQLLLLQGTLNGFACKFLVDCGASENFVSTGFLSRHNLEFSHQTDQPMVRFPNGDSQSCPGIYSHARINFNGHTTMADFVVTQLPHFEAVLGMPWLKQTNPSIDWDNLTLRVSTKRSVILLPSVLGKTDSSPFPILSALQFK